MKTDEKIIKASFSIVPAPMSHPAIHLRRTFQSIRFLLDICVLSNGPSVTGVQPFYSTGVKQERTKASNQMISKGNLFP